MMDITALARPEIRSMRPYVSARSSMSAQGILLNANEAPETLLEGPDHKSYPLHRYPPPQPPELRARLAALYGVPESRLLITRGSDEGIDLLVRVFCRAGKDAILECTPCFGMYRIAAGIQDAVVLAVPRKSERNFEIDTDAVCRMIETDPRVRLVFLTSPNNPTGDCLPAGDLDRVLESSRDRALVILDEAYIEFCEQRSAANRVQDHPNLVVLRTLSKAWAGAGLRCGSVIADPQVIDLLARIMAPYPLASPAIAAAMRVTDASMRPRQQAMIQGVMSRKQGLVSILEDQRWVQAVWPGEANFVLARVDDPDDIVARCDHANIRIRNFDGQPMLNGCIRFSIGSESEMQLLMDTLQNTGACS